jgi:SAM-dependent methyltransferase
LTIVKQHLPENSRNVLDLGSNTGYYLFELARLGYLCHGLEQDPDLVFYTSLVNHLVGIPGVSCECGRLDFSFLDRTPSYDVILCLSIMHHILMAKGMEFAEAILQSLVSKTNHVLFFEMGQSNEIHADWSKRLSLMEPDPETWISQWLIKSGFRHVKTIGTSYTTASRFLFAAYP